MVLFDLIIQINKKVSVIGLEFVFEMLVFQNFGIGVNYIYVDVYDVMGYVLCGVVKYFVNLNGFFENDQFLVCLNYGYNLDNFLGCDWGIDYY